jgi:hypothetical protein
MIRVDEVAGEAVVEHPPPRHLRLPLAARTDPRGHAKIEPEIIDGVAMGRIEMQNCIRCIRHDLVDVVRESRSRVLK